MAKDSIFSDEWRECLREQYMTVVRENDGVTLRTLTEVMAEVGFGEDELRAMYLQATMRADALPDDFVPDVAFVMAAVQAPVEAVEVPLLEAEPEVLPDEPEALLAVDEGESDASALAPHEPSRAVPDRGPTQLSLF